MIRTSRLDGWKEEQMKPKLMTLVAVCLLSSVCGLAWADGSNSTQIEDPSNDVYPARPYLFPWPDGRGGLSYLHDSVTATVPKYLIEDHSYLKCTAATWSNEYQETLDVAPDEGTSIWEAGQTAMETDPQGDSPIPEGDLLSFSVWESDPAHLSVRLRLAVPVRQVPVLVSPYARLEPRQSPGDRSSTDQTYYYVWLRGGPGQEEFYLSVMYDSVATASRIVHPAYDFCDIRQAHMEQDGSSLTASVTLEGDVPIPPPTDARGLCYFFGFAEPGDPYAQPFSYLMATWDGTWQGEIGWNEGGRSETIGSIPVAVDGNRLTMTGSIIALRLSPTFAWQAATMSVIGPQGDQYGASLDSAPDMGSGYVEMTLEPFSTWTVSVPIAMSS